MCFGLVVFDVMCYACHVVRLDYTHQAVWCQNYCDSVRIENIALIV
jgi:hypothetical protein